MGLTLLLKDRSRFLVESSLGKVRARMEAARLAVTQGMTLAWTKVMTVQRIESVCLPVLHLPLTGLVAFDCVSLVKKDYKCQAG